MRSQQNRGHCLSIKQVGLFTLGLKQIVSIPGWCCLTVDIEFLTGVKLPCFWIGTWWSTPVLLLGVTGWWLRALLRTAWGPEVTWPLVVVAAVIVFVMAVMAAIAVAKEEQYNLVSVMYHLFSKIDIKILEATHYLKAYSAHLFLKNLNTNE